MARQFVLLDYQAERVVFHMVVRGAGIDGVQALLQSGQRRVARSGFVHQVVGHAAKGVERNGRCAHAQGQQAAGGKKGFGAALHHGHAGLQVLRVEVEFLQTDSVGGAFRC